MSGVLYVSILHWHEVDGEIVGYISDNRTMVEFYSMWWRDGEREQGNSADYTIHRIVNTLTIDELACLQRLALSQKCCGEVYLNVREWWEGGELVPESISDVPTGDRATWV